MKTKKKCLAFFQEEGLERLSSNEALTIYGGMDDASRRAFLGTITGGVIGIGIGFAAHYGMFRSNVHFASKVYKSLLTGGNHEALIKEAFNGDEKGLNSYIKSSCYQKMTEYLNKDNGCIKEKAYSKHLMTTDEEFEFLMAGELIGGIIGSIIGESLPPTSTQNQSANNQANSKAA